MTNTASPPSSAAPTLAVDTGGDRPSATLYTETVLASGRAVRVRKVTTREYLGAKERAMASVNGKGLEPAVVNARTASALDRELIALALVAYTEPRSWAAEIERQRAEYDKTYTEEVVAELMEAKRPVPVFTLDIDAALSSIAPGEWREVRPIDLLVGSRTAEDIFEDVADYQGVVNTVGAALLPAVDLKGLVGKSRTAAR